jgi:hypothetical protein
VGQNRRSLIPRSSRPTRAALSRWRVKPSAYTGGVLDILHRRPTSGLMVRRNAFQVAPQCFCRGAAAARRLSGQSSVRAVDPFGLPRFMTVNVKIQSRFVCREGQLNFVDEFPSANPAVTKHARFDAIESLEQDSVARRQSPVLESVARAGSQLGICVGSPHMLQVGSIHAWRVYA